MANAKSVMDNPEKVHDEVKVPDSPKALAFTIDFDDGKNVDMERYKQIKERYQNRHKRGQSLSKFEDAPKPTDKKAPLTGNLPRKSSFHSEGYFSSDEKTEKRSNGARSSVLNTVILKGELSLPLRQTGADRMTQSFPNSNFDLPCIDSPEIELKDVSSPELDIVSPLSPLAQTPTTTTTHTHKSSPESGTKTSTTPDVSPDFDCALSDAGTYTLDADDYTEEQKIRMSIDAHYNIEQVSGVTKSKEYIRSLDRPNVQSSDSLESETERSNHKTGNKAQCKILYASAKPWCVDESADKGTFTSISTSGVLSKRPDKLGHLRRSSLVQSEILVEAYTGSTSSIENAQIVHATYTITKASNISVSQETNMSPVGKITSRPPAVPTKIPSPKQTSRSRNHSYSSQNLDLSDSSIETESYLKQSENIISSLQARLSLDSDQESDFDRKYPTPLNNDTKILLKSKAVHVRHNSLDDRNIKLPNKLEHFHNKNFQTIDQTIKSFNQYTQNKVHRIQNSPNNSPIRRSSSFSVKNQFDAQPKCLNTAGKENNLMRNSPNLYSNNSIQRSASTANIKPDRRSSVSSDQQSSYHLETESSSEDEYNKMLAKNKKDLTTTRYNRAFSLRRARLDVEPPPPKCPNTPEMKRKFMPNERGTSVDRKPTKVDISSRYMNITKTKTAPPKPEPVKAPPKPLTRPTSSSKPPIFSRTDSGRFSMRNTKSANPTKKPAREPVKKGNGARSNSSLSSREVDFQNWKRRKSYDPMKAAAEGKRKAELARRQNTMTQSYNAGSQDYDSSPSHSSSVHRSQSFHGTAALEQLASSEDDELTFSGDEDFSPKTESPCELSPRGRSWREPFAGKR